MKVHITLLTEHESHSFMNACDMTNGGTKIFCNKPNIITYTEGDETKEAFEKAINILCTQKEIGKPVFVFAYSDKEHCLLYYRQNIQQISDGKKWCCFDNFIEKQGLHPITDDRRIVQKVGIIQDNEFYEMDNFEFK